MQKNLILTVDIGSPYSQFTIPTIKTYAEKIGVEFLAITEQKLSRDFPQFEKFALYNLIDEYDRILYLDNDIIVMPDCPNLFEKIPIDKLALFNEGGFMPWEPVLQEASIRYDIECGPYDNLYYNTGVMLVPKCCKDVFLPPEFEQDVFANCAAYDQPYINLKIRQHKIKVYDLEYQYNRVEYIDKLTGESRFHSYIIHYAGISNSMRMSILPKDLKAISENFKPKRNMLISMGGGMGDQIDAEPIVRFIKEKVYPGENIKLISDWPELFDHLGIPVCKRAEFKADAIYYQMETLPSDKSLLWQFLSQATCHTTDFASISCLKTIIPDQYKTIKLGVKERSLSKLNKLIKGTSLEDLILVHPGRGWPSKTFPATWWEEVIDGLSDEGLKIAVIGKHISDEQGYVSPIGLDDNVIDLLDLLDTNDLVALISKAKCLISNDSAPIHIAGAFDNNIVLIPSCKHPDHVLPYRNGSKYYKAIALYKELTCDKLDSRPTNLNGESIDKMVGNIEDYLPEVNDVVNKTLQLIKG